MSLFYFAKKDYAHQLLLLLTVSDVVTYSHEASPEVIERELLVIMKQEQLQNLWT